jgi:type II secretory pathway component PulJ
MSDKSSGIDFNRQVFVQPQARTPPPARGAAGTFIAIAVIAALAFLAYKFLPQVLRDSASAGDPALADLDRRLATIEGRLEKLETARRAAVPARKEEPAESKKTFSQTEMKTVYKISPASRQPVHAAPVPTPDPATAQHLSALQSGQAADREAWRATTDKLADMAGQVGTQSVEILRSQDELNQLLARTEMEAIPFELRRGSTPQSVGPVSLMLKSSNPKTQRYTLCVYFQPSCTELKDRTLHEVVQFVVSRNTTPLEVIATKITKDGILGYLEVPRSQRGH